MDEELCEFCDRTDTDGWYSDCETPWCSYDNHGRYNPRCYVHVEDAE